MGQRVAQPHATVTAVLRGSQATETNPDPRFLAGENTAVHETNVANGLSHYPLQGKNNGIFPALKSVGVTVSGSVMPILKISHTYINY